MSAVLSANRVAVIVGVLTGLAAFIGGVAGALPHSWQNTAVAIVGVLTVAAHNLHFITGAQKSEALDKAPDWDESEEPGDPDALPHWPTVSPPSVPADLGDAGAAAVSA